MNRLLWSYFGEGGEGSCRDKNCAVDEEGGINANREREKRRGCEYQVRKKVMVADGIFIFSGSLC